MPQTSVTLYYIHDPMCSWCWGFAPVWKQLQKKIHTHLQEQLTICYVLGGLAPDSDQLMPKKKQNIIRNHWQTIQQQIPGTVFNYDFWKQCQPRRSTYPACRAIIACGMQQPELKNRMITAIQHAYYLNAKNPSDEKELIKVAEKLGLDARVFARDLNSNKCNKKLENEILLSEKLGVTSFPTLVLGQNNTKNKIPIDYLSSENIMQSIQQNLVEDVYSTTE